MSFKTHREDSLSSEVSRVGTDSFDSNQPESACQKSSTMKDGLKLNPNVDNTEVMNEKPLKNRVKTKLLALELGGLPDDKLLGLKRNSSNLSSDSGYSIEHVQMKKGVGLLSGVALIVGTMIGSGIFISPKGVLAGSGSVGASLVVWAFCGLISLLGALSYAELGTMITKSGAEYAYLQEAFSPMHRTLGPVPAFLFAWTSVLILKPALFGVTSMSFAVYLVQPFYGDCVPGDLIVKMVAVLCLFFITFINAYSVSLATKVQNFFTVMKLISVAIIIIGGIYMLVNGNTEILKTGFEDTEPSWSMIALACYDGLWAYDGWNNLNYVTEELKNPHRNLPLAIIVGIPFVTICYILMNISYFTVLSKYDLLMSTAVASSWGDVVLGGATFIIPIAVVFSAFGGCNGNCFTGGRVMYVAAREGHLPEVFSYVHVKQLTPLPSLMVSVLVASCLVLFGEIFQLIDFFSFTAWFFYGLTMACLLVLRYTQKERHRPYKVPIIMPIIVLLVSIYLVVAPIVNDPKIEFLYAFLFSVSGIVFYVPFVVYQKRVKYMTNITWFLQIVLMVAPSKYVPVE
ncbi:hypothetical protein DPMN_180002 [Dreissena polymorpha]|uniref:b(0,+)-type amino acid transporter 1 n=1 Tax=Dreissena polymorpha TaxID=45954 RepID=A0A9D4IMU3_DREPO|nr:hypothetical protein DPMN_180002 [Dreissena polymorpha]